MRKRSRRAPVIEERRRRIAELLLARPGISERAVARELGISRRTVQRDIEAIRAEWAAARQHAYESRMLEDFHRTDETMALLWEKLMRGDVSVVPLLLATIDRRMKLLGIDQLRHELDIGEKLLQYLERESQRGDSHT